MERATNGSERLSHEQMKTETISLICELIKTLVAFPHFSQSPLILMNCHCIVSVFSMVCCSRLIVLIVYGVSDQSPFPRGRHCIWSLVSSSTCTHAHALSFSFKSRYIFNCTVHTFGLVRSRSTVSELHNRK